MLLIHNGGYGEFLWRCEIWKLVVEPLAYGRTKPLIQVIGFEWRIQVDNFCHFFGHALWLWSAAMGLKSISLKWKNITANVLHAFSNEGRVLFSVERFCSTAVNRGRWAARRSHAVHRWGKSQCRISNPRICFPPPPQDAWHGTDLLGFPQAVKEPQRGSGKCTGHIPCNPLGRWRPWTDPWFGVAGLAYNAVSQET